MYVRPLTFNHKQVQLHRLNGVIIIVEVKHIEKNEHLDIDKENQQFS